MSKDIIHETVIRDIIDVINDVRKSEVIKGMRANDSFKSISHASDALTLVFPVLTSRNISIENATMVAKAVERKAVSMLQMLFSAINVNNTNNGLDYIRKFHTNLQLDDKITVDNFMRLMDDLVVQAAEENATISKPEFLRKYELLKEDFKHNINYILPEAMNEISLDEYKLIYSTNTGEQSVIHEAPPIDVDYDDLMDIDYKGSKNHVDILRNQLMDSDVKKANELVPTIMIVNFVSNVDDCPIQNRLVIGVKAKVYPIDSKDIIERLYSKNVDNNGFLKFVRATTREISFVRDFLFAIDKAKIDALSQSRRGSSSKLWKILERRSLKSKVRRSLGQPNDASAISTLVISQEEVEYLKKTYNVHVDNPRVIRPIMEAYNLMSVCIVDELDEVANFIYDTGNDIYERVSFRSLERESSDNDFRKMITLMTKMR